MYKFFPIAILLFIVANLAYAQPAVYAKNDSIKTPIEGLKNGVLVEIKNESNETSEIGILIDGKKDGAWKKYFLNGPMQRLEEYRNGVLFGSVIELNRGGTLELDENYVNGKLNGRRIKYHYGMQSIVENYKMGILDGSRTTYYENNQKQEESFYINAKRDGAVKWYNQEGKLITEFTYKNGRLDGPAKNLFPDGKLQSEGMHKNDVEEGEWKEYDEQGTLIKTTIYKAGVVVKEIPAKK
ncbi:MAG: toxin-antitoxin system YwqK family antitoxin [Bacteroidetes bacterium]|nr:toxin-antitoxin system YwqK family antitoxin [Bacteroidota bacterium]